MTAADCRANAVDWRARYEIEAKLARDAIGILAHDFGFDATGHVVDAALLAGARMKKEARQLDEARTLHVDAALIAYPWYEDCGEIRKVYGYDRARLSPAAHARRGRADEHRRELDRIFAAADERTRNDEIISRHRRRIPSDGEQKGLKIHEDFYAPLPEFEEDFYITETPVDLDASCDDNGLRRVSQKGAVYFAERMRRRSRGLEKSVRAFPPATLVPDDEEDT